MNGPRVVVISVAIVTAVLVPPSQAGTTAIDIRTEPHVTIARVFKAVHAGDVNGDGALDILAGSCGGGYVLFGPFEQRQRIELENGIAHDSGFAIQAPDDTLSCWPAAPGDVNGDGLDDVVLGAREADNNGRSNSGTTYVIFGKTSTDRVDLADFDANSQGDQGFRIDGAFPGSRVGEGVAEAGDVNTDGLADILVPSHDGTTYVVFGQTTGVPFDLLTFETATQGPRGYQIDTPDPERSSDFSAAGAGDVNGDGLADAIVGVIEHKYGRGNAYVVFGKRDPAPVNVKSPTGWGFAIKGTDRCARAGEAVAGLGDVNGDGLSEVIVGAPESLCTGRGKIYVVFGKEDHDLVRLRALGDGGYRISAPNGRISADRYRIGGSAGSSVAASGDINGDGRPEVVIGAYGADYNGRRASGSVFVVYGKPTITGVELGRLGRRGYRIDGAHTDDTLGWFVDGGGDFNGDGIAEVIVTGRDRAFKGYIVWGRP